MNNAYAMSATLEARKNQQATLITAGFAGLMVLLMFFLKWKLPEFEKITEAPGIEVELNLPDEPPTVVSGGGGGGGNNVESPNTAGIAPATPPAPGVDEESKDIETDDNDKAEPAVVKPTNPKPVNKVVENTSVVKTNPKPIENPAPPRPKAVLGRTTTGAGSGGGVSTTYDRSGGSGNGNGVGNGNGNGGGTGGGNGGGNGTGSGTGNGPKRVSGNRNVISPKNMDAGENLKGKVLAEIRVSPDGVGTFIKANRGSRWTSGEAIDIIREWLRRNRFNKISEESIVVYEFNFLMGG